MRRASLAALLIGGLTLAVAPAADAQGGFGAKSARIGPVIGLGGIGDAGISWGGRFEKGIKALPNLGDGILSFMLSVDYYSFGCDNAICGPSNDFNFRYIPFSGTINYHINTKSDKWDAFVGAGLGYLSFSSSYTGPGDISGSGIYFVGRLGGSYAIAKAIQLYADIGAGAATLNAGVMFLLGRKE